MQKIFWLVGRRLWLASLLFLPGCLKRYNAVPSVKTIDARETGVLITPSSISKQKDSAQKTESFFMREKARQKTVLRNSSVTGPKTTSKAIIEARVNDLPVLLEAELDNGWIDPQDNVFLTYLSNDFSIERAHDFYLQELKSFGWRVTQVYADADHIMIIGKKPTKYAVVKLEKKPSTWFKNKQLVVEVVIGKI